MTSQFPTQAELMAAIQSPEPTQSRGLEIYRRNLIANAIRSLSISFPVVLELAGAELFEQLSTGFLKSSPLTAGDWAEWGDSFPEWLNQHPVSDEYPFLADSARLDWLHHQCERAVDPMVDTASFQQLSAPQAGQGFLECNATLTQFYSDYPVVDIWLVHNGDEAERSQWMARAKQKLNHGEGQSALIWRRQWQAQVRESSPGESIWLKQLQQHRPIEEALDATLAEHIFDFSAWLPDAIALHLVTGFYLDKRQVVPVSP